MSVPDHFKRVNYADFQKLLRAWQDAGSQTAGALENRGIKKYPTRHCTSIQHPGSDRVIGSQIEVVGDLPALAEIVAKTLDCGESYFDSVGWATVLVSAQDVMVHGHDVELILGGFGFNQYSWGNANENRLSDFSRGIATACLALEAAYTGGETASLPFLINPTANVGDAPVLFSTAIGSTDVSGLIIGDQIEPGSVILGALSTGVHVNGVSGIIDLPGFPGILLERLENGQLFGDALMKPMGCYRQLTRVIKNAGIKPQAMMAGSGGGVSKLAFDKRDYTYDIQHWPNVSKLSLKIASYMNARTFLKQFNADIGWFVFVAPGDANRAIDASHQSPTPLMYLGEVSQGKRGVRFNPKEGYWSMLLGPKGIWLDPQEF